MPSAGAAALDPGVEPDPVMVGRLLGQAHAVVADAQQALIWTVPAGDGRLTVRIAPRGRARATSP